MSLYIDGAVFDQITVYPPRTAWVAHTATPLSSLETGAYVCEGVCVNAAGTVIFSTNRSAIGSNGWVRRFTGTPAGGYTQDMMFGGGTGEVLLPGYVRAVELDEAGDRIFVASDQNPGDFIYVLDATYGTILETIETDDATVYGGDTYHTSPYDLEFDPIEGALYVQHYYGWYVDKWVETPTAVTMSSFEAIGATEQVELTWG
jgi:DNA-binding beta-propeller fold protein YncE